MKYILIYVLVTSGLPPQTEVVGSEMSLSQCKTVQRTVLNMSSDTIKVKLAHCVKIEENSNGN